MYKIYTNFWQTTTLFYTNFRPNATLFYTIFGRFITLFYTIFGPKTTLFYTNFGINHKQRGKHHAVRCLPLCLDICVCGLARQCFTFISMP